MTRKKPMKSEWLRVRIDTHEKNKITAYADKHDRTVAHVIREYIRRLPNQPREAVGRSDELAA